MRAIVLAVGGGGGGGGVGCPWDPSDSHLQSVRRRRRPVLMDAQIRTRKRKKKMLCFSKSDTSSLRSSRPHRKGTSRPFGNTMKNYFLYIFFEARTRGEFLKGTTAYCHNAHAPNYINYNEISPPIGPEH
jgi:hypothetical protein